MKLSVSKSDNWRVQIPASRQATMNDSEDIEIAISVKEADYVPPGVQVRARINELLFTGITKVKNLSVLEDDHRITSVQVGRPLHLPKVDE